MADNVVVPENITVHLGRPNENAPNVTVPFVDYIKNVASSEIYPTWPESALRANIYAQISIALNRIFTEYYRSRGYDFDITNSTQYDQSFVYGRDYFANISEIVDNIFNSYVVKQGTVNPYYTEYCDGINVTCAGLSQWGTVELANRGYTPYEILRYYYGDDIDIRQARVGGNVESYPGTPLAIGSVGEDVRTIQLELNRISRNYPLIPRIAEANGIFGADTQNAVRVFQQIFDLTQDGIVGKATWYQIKRIYNSVKRTSELFSEGITVSEAMRRFPSTLRKGSSGTGVRVLQFYLRLLNYFIPLIPYVGLDGIFGDETEKAVKAFQNYVGLPADGIVGRRTWNALINQYENIEHEVQTQYDIIGTLPAPGLVFTIGSTGDVVRRIQEYINRIAKNDRSIPTVTVDGIYGNGTANAVRAIQARAGLEQTGRIDPLTWNAILTSLQ